MWRFANPIHQTRNLSLVLPKFVRPSGVWQFYEAHSELLLLIYCKQWNLEWGNQILLTIIYPNNSWFQRNETETPVILCQLLLSWGWTSSNLHSSLCTGLCEPGMFSADGMKPCEACPVGSYQPDYGRTSCVPCGNSVTTRSMGSKGFQDCMVAGKNS